MKNVLKSLCHWLGLEKRSSFINEFFETANYRSCLYIALITAILETWMLVNMVVLFIHNDGSRSTRWFIEHCIVYFLLLCIAITLVITSILYLKKKSLQKNKVFVNFGKLLMYAFSLLCLIFGMYISIKDYRKGEQILCFISMGIFIFGVSSWRPIISIPYSLIVFRIFYQLMDKIQLAGKDFVGVTYATQINYFVLWISIAILILSNYNQRLAEAKKSENITKHSILDDLTGIYNTKSFYQSVSELLKNSKGPVCNYKILFLDINDFKTYNRKFGFDQGNEIIKALAKLISECFKSDIYARFSDDHFVILTDASRKPSLELKLKELRERAALLNPSFSIRINAGLYSPVNKNEEPSVACDHARHACSLAKKDLSKNYIEYDHAMDLQFKKLKYITTNLDEAIEKEYIKVYYQPVVFAKDRTICGVEALARWFDPTYGFLSPDEFIPILEEYRLIHRLDEAILDIVCRDLNNAKESSSKLLPVSVNFSRIDFEQEDVPALIDKYLTKYNLSKDLLHAEITESSLTLSEEILLDVTKKLKSSGTELWLDDFGSGYSSLNILKDFSFDMMKIDMIFLRNFNENEKSKTILKSIVDMAKTIGINTLTEGVESAEQADFLTQIGCERLQGYFFGKPMPIEEIKKLLSN